LAVVKEKPEPGVVIKKIPIPKPKQEEVLVKVVYASICGTDIGIYDWISWAAAHIKPPQVIGHEMVGEVLEVNTKSKTNIKIGDLVSSETHIFCLNCYQCEIKNYHICENMKLFGIGRDGSFAQYATIPLRTTWKNNPKIPVESMSVQEPLGNAVNVVTKANVKGKKVLVMGLGPTGLCAGMAAKAYGAKEIVGVNRREYRRKLAKKVGFDRVTDKLSPKEYGTFDAVLEMSGNRLGIEIALDAARIAGKIIAFGIPKENISIDWGKYLINKELSIESVFGRMIWDTWKDTTKLLVSGKVDLRKIITHRFKLSEFEEAMKVMKSGECGKILLIP
ncbi:MAG: alcohol dehydrogenase catalytic domain-containing protein, partial [Candidatus Levybacteria bacterium]|nr:alcohol dehydrogenase catalytic domain-containing protein [Candidatus Levybacteria bacterium]